MKKILTWIAFLPIGILIGSIGYFILYYTIFFIIPFDWDKYLAGFIAGFAFCGLSINMSLTIVPIKTEFVRWSLIILFALLSILVLVSGIYMNDTKNIWIALGGIIGSWATRATPIND